VSGVYFGFAGKPAPWKDSENRIRKHDHNANGEHRFGKGDQT
jgi:hypothetical protein